MLRSDAFRTDHKRLRSNFELEFSRSGNCGGPSGDNFRSEGKDPNIAN